MSDDTELDPVDEKQEDGDALAGGDSSVGEPEGSSVGDSVDLSVEEAVVGASDGAVQEVTSEHDEDVSGEDVSGEGVSGEDVSGEDVSGEGGAGGEVEPAPVKADPNGPIEEAPEEDEDSRKDWYILKVQVNRENSICDALKRKVKIEGLESYFGEILVPTEDVREFTKAGKPKVVKKKLYPGYIVVNMTINDDTWFAVRETPGIGDFTGAAGKPSPLEPKEIERILQKAKPKETKEEAPEIKTVIRFKAGDRVRVKEGYFQNFEGDVEAIDESNGRITVMINIFGRPTPVELDHWQVEDV